MFSYVQRSFGLKMSEVPVWKAHIRWLVFHQIFHDFQKMNRNVVFFSTNFYCLDCFVFLDSAFSQEFTNRCLFNEKDKNQSSPWGYRLFWVKRFHWEFMDSPSRGSEQMSGFTPEKQKRLLNLKIPLEKEKHRPKPPIFGFHVSFRGWYFNFVSCSL